MTPVYESLKEDAKVDNDHLLDISSISNYQSKIKNVRNPYLDLFVFRMTTKAYKRSRKYLLIRELVNPSI